MPFAHNPTFKGRRDDLIAVRRALKPGGATAIGQAASVTGLGGIGKTQLAVEFVHRYGQFFPGGVFWLSFEDAATVPFEIVDCGAAMGLPGYDGRPFEAKVEAVEETWRQPVPRLLVFDNCEDQELAAGYMPKTGGCRVLLTSRRREFDPSLGIRPVPLETLDPSDSKALLQELCPTLSAEDAARVADALGHLPLALHLAGSYLHLFRDTVSPDKYLEILAGEDPLAHASLQGEEAAFSPTGHDLDVARTFQVSYDRLDDRAEHQAARNMLAAAAWCAPGEPIPRSLLIETLDEATPDTTKSKGLNSLIQLGLLEEAEADTVRIHRLMTAFVKGVGDTDQARVRLGEMLVEKADAINNHGDPRPMLPLQAHLRAVTHALLPQEDNLTAQLCGALGFHLKIIGNFAGAEPFYRKALAISEILHGKDHPETAIRLNNLAQLLQATNRLAEAEPLMRRALEIDEGSFGPDHPRIAVQLNNLASLLQATNRLAEAEPLMRRALEIDEGSFGPDHPDVAIDLNNLATLLQDTNRLAEAEPLMRRALAIFEASLGETHPNTITVRRNLEILLQKMKD